MNAHALQKLRPCIAELLRTCVCPPSLLLRIDHIVPLHTIKSDEVSVPDARPDQKHGALRVYLSDGQLMIQALLSQSPGQPPLKIEQLLELTEFEIRKSRRSKAQGHVIFLAVKTFARLEEDRVVDWTGEGGFIREEAQATASTHVRKQVHSPSDGRKAGAVELSESRPVKLQRLEEPPPSSQLPSIPSPQSSASDEDHFETITAKDDTIKCRRQALSKLHSISPPRTLSGQATECHSVAEKELPTAHDNYTKPAKQPQSSATVGPSLADIPVHTLASLIHPHVKLPRSYQCTVFGIITWISPNLIFKPNSPFPPKRHVKLHDISTTDRYAGVTLAVFMDPKNFLPELGTVALFRGITMQKYGDEVILNAYITLRDWQDGGPWFVDDVTWLEKEGWDVDGLKAWWKRRHQFIPHQAEQKAER